MNKNELEKVVSLLNKNNKYKNENLIFETINIEEYVIELIEHYQKEWDGEYTCKYLEIYEVYKNNEKLGYIGRIVGKNMYGIQWSSDFNIIIEKIISKKEWEFIK